MEGGEPAAKKAKGDAPPPADGGPTEANTIQQGAEAVLYRSTVAAPSGTGDPVPCVVKLRLPKAYRHPELDAKLTKSRINAEVKAIARMRKAGIRVPEVYHVDKESGKVWMELIDGQTLRAAVEARSPDPLAMAAQVGEIIGRMHHRGLIHGDLTSSNVMVRATGGGGAEGGGFELVLIDFGLASVSKTEEDRAVDLYVLERALVSTLPEQEAATLFAAVLAAYAAQRGQQAGVLTLAKYQEVRGRGRKRDAFG